MRVAARRWVLAMLLVHPPTPFAVRIRADAPGTDSGWGGRRLKRSTLKPAAAKARESGKVSLLLFDDPLANPYARCTFSWVWIRGSRASIGVCMARSRASGPDAPARPGTCIHVCAMQA